MMNSVLTSFKQIGILISTIGLVLLTAYILTILLLFMGENVVGALGLGLINNTTSVAGIVYSYITTGITGIYSIASIVSIAAGIGILAVVVQMFGFNVMDRFNISVGNLASLLKKVVVISGAYTASVFLVAILRIIFGIIAVTVLPAFGFSSTTQLDSITTLVGTVFTTLFSILTVGVGLLTLAFVAGAFGFEIEMGGKKVSGKYKKNY